MKSARKEAMTGYLFLTPWILGFILWIGGPIATSIFLSFTKYEIVTPMKWVGLNNYQELMSDPLFWQSLKVTFYYSFGSIPLLLIMGLIIALLLNQKIKELSIFRTIYYIPSVTSGVAVALLWVWIFNPEIGIFNTILAKFGIKGPLWLQSTEWVIPAFIIMSLWGVGGSMLLYLAALQGVPTQLYEAAELDGASGWQKFWKITLPMITPVLFFNLIMGIINSFQVFTSSYVMTNGGPANASLFYVLYLYNNGFLYFKMGYASALAWILFVIILFLTLLIFKSTPFWLYYEGKVRGR